MEPQKLGKPNEKLQGCGCHPLELSYDPNVEKGAEFYCDKDVNMGALPALIKTNNKCMLFCDKVVMFNDQLQ